MVLNQGVSTLVFSCRDFDAFAYIGSSDYGLISYNEMGFKSDGKQYWGKDFAEKYNVTMFAIASRDANWFPVRSMWRARAIWDDVVKFHAKNWYGYGHSMGGYACLKFARLFETERSLSFCPQISIDPKDVGSFDQRYEVNFNRQLNKNMILEEKDLNGISYIFYDPTSLADATHVKNIQRLGEQKVVAIKCFYTGHETVRIFSGSKILPLIDACAHNDVRCIQSLARQARRDRSDIRVRYLAPRTLDRHPNWAWAIIQKYHGVVEAALIRYISANFANMQRYAEAVELANFLTGREELRSNRDHIFWLLREVRRNDPRFRLEWAIKRAVKRSGGLALNLIEKYSSQISSPFLRFMSAHYANHGSLHEARLVANLLSTRPDIDGSNRKHLQWLRSHN